MKKVIYVALVVFALLMGFALLAPFLFKDKLLQAIKTEFNKNYNATLDFKEVDISLIRSFPDLRLNLGGLRIGGVNEYKNVDLINAGSVYLDVDLMSAIKGETYKLNEFTLKDAIINALVNAEGKANWDIAKDTTTSESSDFNFKVNGYKLDNCTINYIDKQVGITANLEKINHKGKGDFSQVQFDLDTETNIEKLSVEYGGMQYLRNSKASVDAVFNVLNDKNMQIKIKENEISINDLILQLIGNVTMRENDTYAMDIKFDTKKADFKSFLSLIPSAYTADFKNVETSGKLTFNGFAKGEYKENVYPNFGLNIDIDNARFKYPSLPKSVENINAKVHINNPSSSLNDMTVQVPAFHFAIDNQPFDMKLFLKNVLQNPAFDVTAKGKLNLDNIAKAFPIEGVQQLNGLLDLDVTAKGTQNDVSNKNYGALDVRGFANLSNMAYKSADLPKTIQIAKANLTFSPQVLALTNTAISAGSSDLQVEGKLTNYIPYFLKNEKLAGTVSVNSTHLNANDFMTNSKKSTPTSASNASTTTDIDLPKNVDVTLNTNIQSLQYENTTFNDVKGSFVVKEGGLIGQLNANSNYINANDFMPAESSSESSSTSNTAYIDVPKNVDFELKSVIKKLKYNNTEFNDIAGAIFLKNGFIKGNIDIATNYINLDEYMTETEPASTAKAEPFIVPRNVDFVLKSKINKLKYDKLEMNNISGAVTVRDEKVLMQNLEGNGLQGNMILNGYYSTKNMVNNKPAFDMNFKLKDVDMASVFTTFNSVEKIAPIAQYIKGKISTDLNFKGALTPEMMPDLNTLSGEGFLGIIQAMLSGFKPMEVVADKLKMDKLRNIQLNDMKNYIEVNNGKVLVRPFDYAVGNYKMNIGGSHGFDKSLNYDIKLLVPRSELGSAANSALSNVFAQANKAGVNLQASETIDVAVKLTGTITQPQVKVDWAKSAGSLKTQVTEAVTQKVDEVKNQAIDKAKEEADKLKAEAEAKKKELEDKARAEIEKAKAEAEAKKKELEEKAKAELEKAKEKAKEEAKKKAQDALKGIFGR